VSAFSAQVPHVPHHPFATGGSPGMYRIARKEVLNAQVKLLEVEAPYVARKAEPGQFIILRIREDGERVPFTIAAYDREKGTVSIIFQEVGATTKTWAKWNRVM
jgi:NAD(P)H-flavin reductase